MVNQPPFDLKTLGNPLGGDPETGTIFNSSCVVSGDFAKPLPHYLLDFASEVCQEKVACLCACDRAGVLPTEGPTGR